MKKKISQRNWVKIFVTLFITTIVSAALFGIGVVLISILFINCALSLGCNGSHAALQWLGLFVYIGVLVLTGKLAYKLGKAPVALIVVAIVLGIGLLIGGVKAWQWRGAQIAQQERNEYYAQLQADYNNIKPGNPTFKIEEFKSSGNVRLDFTVPIVVSESIAIASLPYLFEFSEMPPIGSNSSKQCDISTTNFILYRNNTTLSREQDNLNGNVTPTNMSSYHYKVNVLFKKNNIPSCTNPELLKKLSPNDFVITKVPLSELIP